MDGLLVGDRVFAESPVGTAGAFHSSDLWVAAVCE